MNEDKSTRYHRMRRRIAFLGGLWRVLLLAALLGTGASAALRDGAVWLGEAAGSENVGAPLAVGAFAIVLLLLHEAAGLPLAFYGGFVLERRYGLSSQTAADWLRDQAKSIALAGALGSAAAILLYDLIGRFPGVWWLVAGVVFSVLTAGLAALAPVVLLPLFYRLERLVREPLAERLLELAARARTTVAGAYEWSVSGKTRKANAALAGLGPTRRILVSDTMLASCSDEEIEVVLAHELGHHVHGDMWSSLAVQSGVTTAGFGAAALAVGWLGPGVGLIGPGDVAGLPLILLASGAVSLLALPIRLSFSRFCERRADRFAIDLTANPEAFVTAMRRLEGQNLAEPNPSRLVQWLFYSHPPTSERIATARASRTARGSGTIVAVSR